MWLLLLGVSLMAIGFFIKPKEVIWLVAAIVFAIQFGFPNQNITLYLLFMLGVGLIVFEFYIPDFGLAGMIGLAVEGYTLYQLTHDLTETVLMLVYAMVLVLAVFVLLPRLGLTFSAGPKYILHTSLNKAQGFESASDCSHLVNQVGIALTDLRPIGKANFASVYYDVVSEDAFIKSGEPIYVEKVVGSKIYVRRSVE